MPAGRQGRKGGAEKEINRFLLRLVTTSDRRCSLCPMGLKANLVSNVSKSNYFGSAPPLRLRVFAVKKIGSAPTLRLCVSAVIMLLLKP